jgi:hypothetical protein
VVSIHPTRTCLLRSAVFEAHLYETQTITKHLATLRKKVRRRRPYHEQQRPHHARAMNPALQHHLPAHMCCRCEHKRKNVQVLIFDAQLVAGVSPLWPLWERRPRLPNQQPLDSPKSSATTRDRSCPPGAYLLPRVPIARPQFGLLTSPSSAAAVAATTPLEATNSSAAASNGKQAAEQDTDVTRALLLQTGEQPYIQSGVARYE